MFERIIDRNSVEYSRRFIREECGCDRDLYRLDCVVKELENVVKDFPTFSFEKFTNMTSYAFYIGEQRSHVEAVTIMNDFEKSSCWKPELHMMIAYTMKIKRGERIGTLFVIDGDIDVRCKHLSQMETDLIRFRTSLKD